MQLNQFNGGINVRMAPHTIGTNEGIIYTNIDNAGVSLKPIKADKDENTSIDKYLYNYKDTWLSSANYRDYQKFQEKLYYSDGLGRPQKTTDGVNWFNLGIVKPDNAPTITEDVAGVIEGTYQYCYTYYNNSDGTESMPSPYSSELTVSGKKIKVTYIASTDVQVDKIRIYRIGGNLPTMELVIEVANATSNYLDNLGDLQIEGTVLATFSNKEAPTGLSYIKESNAMLFGAKDDKLYYSQIAYVDYWSAFNFIDFDDTITGIGAIGNGLLVFTEFKTYIVTGTSPETLSKYLLSGNQGCLSHRTISFAKNTLIWLSSDGICASSGGDIQIVSRDKMGKIQLDNVKDSVVYDDVYYLSYDTDDILCFDTRFGNIIKHISGSTECFHIYDDVLYYSYNGQLYSMFQDTNYREFLYKSAELGDGQISNLKNYKNIYLNVIGTMAIKVYIDSVLIGTYNVDTSTHEIKLPQDKRRGYSIQFEINGVGELREIQYVVEGRQNGK